MRMYATWQILFVLCFAFVIIPFIVVYLTDAISQTFRIFASYMNIGPLNGAEFPTLKVVPTPMLA